MIRQEMPVLGAYKAWRDAALAHPGLYPLVAQFRLNHAPGLALLERQAAIFAAAGLVPRSRARHFRAFQFWLNGACLAETTTPHSPSAIAPLPFSQAAEAFPRLMEVAPHLTPDRSLGTFQHGLEQIIRAIEAEVSALGGHKSLYSDAYYDEETFWSRYGGEEYARVKKIYDPHSRLPGLYAKAVGRR